VCIYFFKETNLTDEDAAFSEVTLPSSHSFSSFIYTFTVKVLMSEVIVVILFRFALLFKSFGLIFLNKCLLLFRKNV